MNTLRNLLAAGAICCFGSAAWADQVKTHLDEGRLHHSMGSIEKAAFEYRMAIKYDIFAAEPHFNLGVALYQLGKTTEAAREIQKAIKSDYKDPFAKVMLGLASSDPAENREAYRQAVGNEPAYGAPGFDPDEELLKRKLLPKKAPRTLNSSQRWASFAAAEAAPAATPLNGGAGTSPDTALHHGRLAVALSAQAEDPGLSKERAAELRRQAAVEYSKAATLSLQ